MGTGEFLGNLISCWGVTCDGLASRPGGVKILLAASCYGNQDKLWSDEPVLAPKAPHTLKRKNWSRSEQNLTVIEFQDITKKCFVFPCHLGHFNMSKPVIFIWEFLPPGPASGKGLWRELPAIVKAKNRV